MAEIADVIISSQTEQSEMHEMYLKEAISILDVFGTNLLNKLGASMSEEKSEPKLIESYPKLFATELVQINNARQKMEMEAYRARRMQMHHNLEDKLRKEESHGRDTGTPTS